MQTCTFDKLRILNLPYLNACFLHIPVLSDPFLYALFFSHFKFLSRYMVSLTQITNAYSDQIAYQYFTMAVWHVFVKVFFFVELLNIMHTILCSQFPLQSNLDQLVCGQRPESFNLECSAALLFKNRLCIFWCDEISQLYLCSELQSLNVKIPKYKTNMMYFKITKKNAKQLVWT